MYWAMRLFGGILKVLSVCFALLGAGLFLFYMFSSNSFHSLVGPAFSSVFLASCSILGVGILAVWMVGCLSLYASGQVLDALANTAEDIHRLRGYLMTVVPVTQLDQAESAAPDRISTGTMARVWNGNATSVMVERDIQAAPMKYARKIDHMVAKDARR